MTKGSIKGLGGKWQNEKEKGWTNPVNMKQTVAFEIVRIQWINM